MGEFLVNQDGYHIWYDLKFTKQNKDLNVNFCVETGRNEPVFYIRIHREDGPAFVIPDSISSYYQHGKLHRIDGPARVYANGYLEWWLDDEEYSFDEWCEESNKTSEEINFLKLKWNIT